MVTKKLNTNVEVTFDKYENMKEVKSPYIKTEESIYNKPYTKWQQQ